MADISNRRKNVVSRLQAQLQKGTKPLKVDGKTVPGTTQLSDKDRQRIEKEIENLSKKLIL
jgi:hypothetical protein